MYLGHDVIKTLHVHLCPVIEFVFGFTQSEVTVQETDGTVELTVGVVAGRGTEIPFNVNYFTTDGSAEGT